jgi:hypothetical protein
MHKMQDVRSSLVYSTRQTEGIRAKLRAITYWIAEKILRHLPVCGHLTDRLESLPHSGWLCERPGGLSRATARTAPGPGGSVSRLVAARRGPQGHQRLMACSCVATAGHEALLLCAVRTAGRAAPVVQPQREA